MKNLIADLRSAAGFCHFHGGKSTPTLTFGVGGRGRVASQCGNGTIREPYSDGLLVQDGEPVATSNRPLIHYLPAPGWSYSIEASSGSGEHGVVVHLNGVSQDEVLDEATKAGLAFVRMPDMRLG